MSATEEVLSRIPHRPPVLLVDDVVACEPGRSLRARVRLAPPGDVVLWPWDESQPYPPALLLESLAQAAVLLTRWDSPNPDVLTGALELLADVQKVEFPAVARPGDVVEHEVTLLRRFDAAIQLGGRSLAGGTEVCRVEQLTVAARAVADLSEEE